MDLVEQNFGMMASLRIHNMSVEETVTADAAVESKFHRFRDHWWREVKPFFYRPVNPLAAFRRRESFPKPWAALGGYYHVVPDGEESNGALVANEISQPAAYELESLKRKRNQILRSLGVFRVQPVACLEDLLTGGYDTYLDWERRTEGVRTKRSSPEVFQRWIKKVFAHPYCLLLGAYAGDRLVGFMTAYATEGIAHCSKIFSHSEFHAQTPSSAMLYSFVRIAANNPEIRRVWHGLRGLNPSLERYKAVMGFQHVSYPVYVHVRTGLRPLAKFAFPQEYRRLYGQYPAQEAA